MRKVREDNRKEVGEQPMDNGLSFRNKCLGIAAIGTMLFPYLQPLFS